MSRGRAVGTSRHKGFRGRSTPNKRANITRSVYIFPMLANASNGLKTLGAIALLQITRFAKGCIALSEGTEDALRYLW